MLTNRLIFLVLNALGLTFNAHCQENNIPIAEWRVHLPHTGVKTLDFTGTTVFAGTQINGFYFHRDDNSFEILSTTNYLNDIIISKARYHSALNMLMLGYENGNIDIIQGGATINIQDIKRKNIVGSKRINNITFEGNFAYLACEFGLVVFNLQKLEIKETYSNLAPSGLSNRVFGTAFSSDKDSIFLATERGVMAARNSPLVNLMDYSNWHPYGPSENIPSSPIVDVANYNGIMYAGINNDGIYYFDGLNWVSSSIPANTDIKFFRNTQGKLLIGASSDIITLNGSSYTVTTDPFFQFTNEATLDASGNLWLAHDHAGLVTNREGPFKAYHPNGPVTNDAFRLSYVNKNIIVVQGGYNNHYGPLYSHGPYNVFDNYSWKYSYISIPAQPWCCTDITNVSYNPVDKSYYFSSHNQGLVVLKPDGVYELWDDTIAPFQRALPEAGPYVRITDAQADKNGNLWVTNSHTQVATAPSLHMRKTDGTWTSKSFNIEAARYPVEILIDDNDYKWIRLRHDLDGGIIVYNDQTNSYKYLTNLEGDGGLPNKAVRTIAMDKNGDIWVGTNAGIAIFYNTYDIFSSSTINATKPLYDGFPLLYNEVVTCIEVDGGNRKWIGTLNGLWLLNDDGTEVINYFSINNSPLLSNVINDVEINEATGEVFIATDQGIISYRGTATEVHADHSQVKIFPNPVKPEFNGLIGISGLVNDASVKITDIYGNLIYETKAEGGTAVWNGKDYNSQRAASGVYLIFSSDEDGEETFAGKIAVE